MPTLAQRLLPEDRLTRRLAVQSVLFAVGEGIFLTGNAVFFTQIVGLSAAQVGLGFTIAGVVSFIAAVPLGRSTDRFGAKRTWAVSAFLGAGLYGCWPWINGFGAYVAMVIVLELVGTAGHSGRGAYTLGALERSVRVGSLAWMRSALNLGFTLGALLGGLALAANSDPVVRSIPVFTAVLLVVNAVYVWRLPDIKPTDIEPAVVEVEPEEAPTQKTPLEKVARGTALRNWGFLATSFCSGVLSTNQVLLTIVIPLWLVQETDAPRVLLAWLFGTNTVLAVLLQVRAARGVDSVVSAVRAARVSMLFFVASCAIVAFTHDTIGWITILLVWIGHVTVTGAELFEAAGEWGLMSELSDPDRLGEYQGAAQLGSTLGRVWAPAAYTWLAIEQGALGWAVIALVVVAAAVGIGPSARAAERFLAVQRGAVSASG